MNEERQDRYAFSGINVDVNPYAQKDEELNACLNFYSHKLYAKKVRFGYAALSSNTGSNSPVRNLISFAFPNGQRGILKVQGYNIYRYSYDNQDWGASIYKLTVDVPFEFTFLNGQLPYLHLTNGTDHYLTYDGFVFKSWAVIESITPPPHAIVEYQDRIYMDQNQQRLIQSAVDWDAIVAYQTNPITLNAGDPASAGIITVDSGNGGKIIKMTSIQGSLYIYKETAVYRFTGNAAFQMDYGDSVIPQTVVTHKKSGVDYFMSPTAIMRNDGQSVKVASLGINDIILKTIAGVGFPTPFAASWNDFTFFYIGTMLVGKDTIPNGMFVHDERYDEWYIWQVGHNMTCFGSYYDVASRSIMLISGDDQGNTYTWSRNYNNDAGKAIPYRLRTKYDFCGKPESTKVVARIPTSTDNDAGATLSVAKDFSDDYKPLRGDTGNLSSGFVNPLSLSRFKGISLQISGSTTTTRPEFYGYTITYLNKEEELGAGGKRWLGHTIKLTNR